MKKYINFLILIAFASSLVLSTSGCQRLKDIHKPVDLRKTPLDPDERARRNIEEGRGISIGSIGNRKTTYEFSTSNPMWRASLETLDFIPLTTVDYSGGMIITDWYSEGSSTENESLKITVRFLSNEIRSESLKVIVHKKNCNSSNNCSVSLLPEDSKIKIELLSVILKKAALLNTKDKSSKKKQ